MAVFAAPSFCDSTTVCFQFVPVLYTDLATYKPMHQRPKFVHDCPNLLIIYSEAAVLATCWICDSDE